MKIYKKMTEKKWPLLLCGLALSIYFLNNYYQIKSGRGLAYKVDLNTLKNLSADYQKLPSCEKEEYLWDNKILASQYINKPGYKGIDLAGMALSSMDKKMTNSSDSIPRKWKKYIHAHGSVARISYVSLANHSYTGAYKGVECGLIRLSLTYKPYGKRGVAPGLAIKLFNHTSSSRNFSALTSLKSQGQDYNFFKNPFSNIVAKGKGIGPRLVRRIFKRTTKKPEEISIKHLANITEGGRKVKKAYSPDQVFLVAPKRIHTPSKKRDVRDDFERIPRGSVLFKVYAYKFNEKDYNVTYSESVKKDRLAKAKHIGNIITKSEFISSLFGDDYLFFNHQRND